VTFWADLEPRSARTGALRLIPGSHLPGFEHRLCEYRTAEPAMSGFGHWEWPHVVVETEPGDVVAFHAHLMNCAQGGIPRLAWTIDYLPWPGLGRQDQIGVVRDLVRDAAEFSHESYDRDRWPAWREWAAGAAHIPSRAVALERLELLGVLTGASDG
jgi:ectoine hydroxylase-related dioxygenase (phytanoyl-CoA dioxygenase family)